MYQCFKSFLGKLFFINERPNANEVDSAAKVLLNTSSSTNEDGNSCSQSSTQPFVTRVIKVTATSTDRGTL